MSIKSILDDAVHGQEYHRSVDVVRGDDCLRTFRIDFPDGYYVTVTSNLVSQ